MKHRWQFLVFAWAMAAICGASIARGNTTDAILSFGFMIVAFIGARE